MAYEKLEPPAIGHALDKETPLTSPFFITEWLTESDGKGARSKTTSSASRVREAALRAPRDSRAAFIFLS